ncbi:MAG: NifU family protein, partial [Deltaproteobacteria bacterium]|nr:NifU family protein [Deltaproteobacteria bacterium]
SVRSILQALPYSELAKEEVLDFIQETPGLLILDVRGDGGWNQGHLPQAKHVPASELFGRLNELPDKTRPILVFSANGNTSVSVCQLLAKEGYLYIFNALGGMAAYSGDLIRPKIELSDPKEVLGSNPKLIAKVLEVLDRDVRPGLKRDGGDIKVLEVEEGLVKIKMVGACVGCGAQQRTVDFGIAEHLKKLIPEIKSVEDVSRVTLLSKV